MTTPTSNTKYQVEHAPFPIWEDGKLVGGTDWLGNEFRVGDVVMYAVSAGRGQMMAYGTVVDVKMGDGRMFANRRDEVNVQVKTIKTSGHWNNGERTRASWVNSMNITAVPPDLLQGSLKELMKYAEIGFQARRD